MLYLVLFLIALIILGFMIIIKSGDSDGQEVGCTISAIGCACIILIVIIHLLNVNLHCDELATIKNSQSLIAVHTQAIEDLDKQMNGLSKSIGGQALLNADSPYRSLIETKAKYISDLSRARSRVAEAKTSIIARKLGMMSYIIRWYGEE